MFEELRQLAGDSGLILPGRGSLIRPFAANALDQAMGAVSFPIPPFTIHDLRTGSTILHEQGFSSDVVEKALNHTIGGVRGVYNRAEYADQKKSDAPVLRQLHSRLERPTSHLKNSMYERYGP
jgi:integrase